MMRGTLAAFVLVALCSSACARLNRPPERPDPAWLGCYRLQTNLPASFTDSLVYELPAAVQLGYTPTNGQWTVLPTDEDWAPGWGIYDGLPSGYYRRQLGYSEVPVLNRDSVQRIPGDSIDIGFPSALGQLVLRLGRAGEDLTGRAEWVLDGFQSFLQTGVGVRAVRTSCDRVPTALRRTRYR